MACKIAFKNSVSKDLKKIDRSIAKDILDAIDSDLSKNASTCPSLKGKFAGLRRFRVEDYRVIFSIIEPETVLILRIAHRKEIYRK